MDQTQKRVAIGISAEWPLAHHYDMIHGILSYASERDWNCLIDTFVESEITRNITGKQYDGCIARVNPALAEYVKRVKMPCVNVWNSSPVKDIPSILVDFNSNAKMAIDYFVQKKFKKFAFLGEPDSACDKEQGQYFAKAADELGLTYTSLFVREDTSDINAWAEQQRQLFEWVSKWDAPIAVFASNDHLGRSIAQTCVDRGLTIPDDVAIMGSGNTSVQCESFSPTLTSVDLGFDKIGYIAATELDRLMEGGAPAAPKKVFFGKVVERRSTDVLAVEDRVLAQALRYIWDNVHRSYNVDEVVQGLSVTRRSLERRFRNLLGRSINQEIIRVRVERVKQQLVDTSESVKSIAAASGFKNLEHLYYVFQKHLSMAPGAYRKKMRKEAEAEAENNAADSDE